MAAISGEQEEEVLVMESIFGHDNTFMWDQTQLTGVITVPPGLQRPVLVKPPEPDEEVMSLTALPPVCIEFSLPAGYPSEAPPENRVVSSWLTPSQMLKVWKRLLTLWEQGGGNMILFEYTEFLKNDCLTFLGLDHELDVTFFIERARTAAVQAVSKSLHANALPGTPTGRRALPAAPVPVPAPVPAPAPVRAPLVTTLTRTLGGCSPPFGMSWEDFHNSDEEHRASMEASLASEGRLASLKFRRAIAEHRRASEEDMRVFMEGRHTSVEDRQTSVKDRRASEEDRSASGDSRRTSGEDRRPSGEGRRASVEALRARYRLTLPASANIHQYLETHQQRADAAVFRTSRFRCKVCGDDRLGADCVRLERCGHVYCRACLKSYYAVLIRDGEVQSLRCPEEMCPEQATPAEVRYLVGDDLFERYDSILLKTSLSTMADVVTCPRQHCQKPVVLDAGDNLGRCAHCEHTFCAICQNAYHGNNPCAVKSGERMALVRQYKTAREGERSVLERRYGRRQLQRLVEEADSAAWMSDHSERCPRCSTPIEKIDGCNKMSCTKCGTLFCWLCNAKLPRENPYTHFNVPGSKCYNQLFAGVVEGALLDDELGELAFDDVDPEQDWVPMGYFL